MFVEFGNEGYCFVPVYVQVFPLRLSAKVNRLPESWPEPPTVTPPLIVWVAILMLDPLTVPTHESVPSFMTMLVIPAPLFEIMMLIAWLTPVHTSVPV